MPDSLTRVFLCYRHEDTPWFAHLLKNRLQAHFDHVFMDLAIKPGDDFTQEIKKALNQCRVLLALIGTKWLTSVDEQGQRKLDDKGDWVVQEIKEALRLGVRVIPVLVDGAIMPKESVLPEALFPLANRHAVIIGHESFDVVADTLILAIENELSKDSPGPGGPEQVYQRALDAMGTGNWLVAADLLLPLLGTGYPGAAMLHAEAIRQLDMASNYNRAVDAIRRDRFSEALDLLRPLVDAGYLDAATLTTEVTKRVTQHAEYDQGQGAMQAGDWSAALAVLGPLRDVGFRDAADLYGAAAKQKDLADRYDRGCAAIADRKWSAALDELRPLNQRHYRDAPGLFALASKRHRARVQTNAVVGALVSVVILAIAGVWFVSTNSGGTADPTTTGPATPPPETSASSINPDSPPLDDDLIVVPRVVEGNLPMLYPVSATSGSVGDPVEIGPTAAYEPLISPDRKSIIYQERNGDLRTLHVIAADGTGDRVLFNPRLPACEWMLRPAWNRADPNELAVTCIEDETFTLMIVRLDDQSSRTLVTGQWIDDLTLSLDGKTIVYFAAKDVAPGIYSISADGGGTPVRLADGRRPMWSPDGRTIAFTKTDDPTDAKADQDIYLMDPDGSNLRELTSGPDRDSCPNWSPDGSELVFMSDRETNDEGDRAWLIKADGTDLHRLSPADDAYVDSPPAWAWR